MIDIINEYVLTLHGMDRAYRVYAYNEQLAIKAFEDECERYSNTNNEEYKKYWEEALKTLTEGKYTLIHNIDFRGVRVVI